MNTGFIKHAYPSQCSETRISLSKRVLCLLTFAALLGCAQKNESQEDEDLPGYPLAGVVLELDRAAESMRVAHEDIPDFMPAMTMDFRVRRSEMEGLTPKTKIYARLVRDEDGGFRLVHVQDEAAAAESANANLTRQVNEKGSGYYFGEGELMPDFALRDQNGEVVVPESLEGKPFVLNFIFTRCNDAKMCPLSTSKMATLQRLAAESGIANLEFISITLDPEFDTPEVLKAYQEAYGIDDANFRFVTGERAIVQQLVKSLGVTRIEGETTINHSLATVLVDKDRKIVLRSERSAWDPQEYLAAIQSL